jgi:hypothetical protein
MFISICRRGSEAEEAEAEEAEVWAGEAWVWAGEAWVWDEGEVDGAEAEDTMVAQEDIYSTIQPISKITTRLMSTFIQRRPPM